MKHAFIFGTSVFLSYQNTLSLSGVDKNTEFLKILSFYNLQHSGDANALIIDANIKTPAGEVINISGNKLENGPASVHIKTKPHRIWVLQNDHHEPILDVYQLNEHEFHGLSSHILNEIHAQHPDAVFTIKGNFIVEDAHIMIENEKMFINNNGFANGVENAHDGIILSTDEPVN